MNKLKFNIVVIMGVSVAALMPLIAHSNQNSSIYDHSNHDHGTNFHDLKKWKTGSNFNVRKRRHHAPVSNKKYEANNYALTEPQKKSVNPWVIKKSENNGFSDMNAKRPWGSVPEEFSGKTKKKNNKDSVNSNVHGNQRPKYQPFGNNNLLLNQNRNPSLIPIAGHFPTYSDSAGFSPMYTNPGYGFGGYNSYPFMNRGYMPFYGYGWR